MRDLLPIAARSTDMLSILIKFALAIFCGGFIGLERGTKRQAAGFRTHILVCTGATIAMVTGLYIFEYISPQSDPSRLGAQVISGIGFLGVGTIINTNMNKVKGLTTAAGLWASACIGLAIGIGYYELAVIGTVVVMVAIVVFQKIDEIFYARSPVTDLYIEMQGIESVHFLIDRIKENGLHISSIEIHKPKSGISGGVGILLCVKKINKKDKIDVVNVISDTRGLTFIEETI